MNRIQHLIAKSKTVLLWIYFVWVNQCLVRYSIQCSIWLIYSFNTWCWERWKSEQNVVVVLSSKWSNIVGENIRKPGPGCVWCQGNQTWTQSWHRARLAGESLARSEKYWRGLFRINWYKCLWHHKGKKFLHLATTNCWLENLTLEHNLIQKCSCGTNVSYNPKVNIILNPKILLRRICPAPCVICLCTMYKA